MAEWLDMINTTSRSGLALPWRTGGTDSYAYLRKINGKWFVVQYSRSTGELLTAFMPNAKQLNAMLRILGKRR
ncbi:hypothetical protein [Planomonospora venezuelensis]|uniref:Uncharacterized protein n=1 Tax=Planomonospora venezuelensis TaxID=1999 RepID=A0A841CUV4_PLAVE|nr:hypothetical protein [Planomonospora venezuelensis]MBB5961641.1 hypothetical protein [Planomonospora venezuelensis]GIM98787.1 hypothetical protein Pve01_04460 [Planomonospora venezuelensis]